MSKTIKIGFIGTGGIGRTQMRHLKGISGVEVVAAADISEKALESAKQDWPALIAFNDYREMLKAVPEMDAVSVCTPNALHMEPTVAALNAGKHVMVEKPLAMNAREGQKMVDAARKACKHLSIGFQERFSANATMLRKLIEAGELGKINYVRCQALRRRGIPNWGVFGRKDLQGGGPMIDIGVHILEVAHFLMGAPRPITATGNTWTYLGNKPCNVACPWSNWDHKTYTVEDLATGMIRFENGAMLSIEASFAAHIEEDVWNLQIMGDKGGAIYNPAKVFSDRSGYMLNSTPAFVGKWDAFERKMRHFVEVVRDGKTNLSSGEAGLAVQKILDGVYASAEAGREVRIK